jgi:hypothetical protein
MVGLQSLKERLFEGEALGHPTDDGGRQLLRVPHQDAAGAPMLQWDERADFNRLSRLIDDHEAKGFMACRLA